MEHLHTFHLFPDVPLPNSVLVHVSHSNACSKSQIGPIGWPIGSAAPPVAGVSVEMRPGIKLCPSRNVVPFSRSKYKTLTVNKTLLSWYKVSDKNIGIYWNEVFFYAQDLGYPIFRQKHLRLRRRFVGSLTCQMLCRGLRGLRTPRVFPYQFLGGSNIVHCTCFYVCI